MLSQFFSWRLLLQELIMQAMCKKLNKFDDQQDQRKILVKYLHDSRSYKKCASRLASSCKIIEDLGSFRILHG